MQYGNNSTHNYVGNANSIHNYIGNANSTHSYVGNANSTHSYVGNANSTHNYVGNANSTRLCLMQFQTLPVTVTRAINCTLSIMLLTIHIDTSCIGLYTCVHVQLYVDTHSVARRVLLNFAKVE